MSDTHEVVLQLLGSLFSLRASDPPVAGSPGEPVEPLSRDTGYLYGRCQFKADATDGAAVREAEAMLRDLGRYIAGYENPPGWVEGQMTGAVWRRKVAEQIVEKWRLSMLRAEVSA